MTKFFSYTNGLNKVDYKKQDPRGIEHDKQWCEMLDLNYQGPVEKADYEALQDRTIEGYSPDFMYATIGSVARELQISNYQSVRMIAIAINDNSKSRQPQSIKIISDIMGAVLDLFGDSRKEAIKELKSYSDEIEVSWVNNNTPKVIKARYDALVDEVAGYEANRTKEEKPAEEPVITNTSDFKKAIKKCWAKFEQTHPEIFTVHTNNDGTEKPFSQARLRLNEKQMIKRTFTINCENLDDQQSVIDTIISEFSFPGIKFNNREKSSFAYNQDHPNILRYQFTL